MGSIRPVGHMFDTPGVGQKHKRRSTFHCLFILNWLNVHELISVQNVLKTYGDNVFTRNSCYCKIVTVTNGGGAYDRSFVRDKLPGNPTCTSG